MPLEYSRVEMTTVGLCPTSAMPCAVVELTESGALPRVRNTLEGHAYNEAEHILAFSTDTMGVVVRGEEVRVYMARDEEDALRAVDRLQENVCAAEG